jgi:copper chaperone NosL
LFGGGLLSGLLLLALLLAGCDQQQQAGVSRSPVPFHAGDECHVCGMLITRFPGPKGEAYVYHEQRALKFCSTRDLFAWLLQPETTAVVEAIYVHDMANTDWNHPDDRHLIDARTAWYVVGSTRRGAMGPTLASFAKRADAEAFARQYGGRVLPFESITLPVLEAMLSAAPDSRTSGQSGP